MYWADGDKRVRKDHAQAMLEGIQGLELESVKKNIIIIYREGPKTGRPTQRTSKLPDTPTSPSPEETRSQGEANEEIEAEDTPDTQGTQES